MEAHGTKFVRNAVVSEICRDTATGQLEVAFEADGQAATAQFDTVLSAIGRRPNTSQLGLENAGVRVEANGKIKTEAEQTNVDHIFALGDVAEGVPELTPVAIQAGQQLAHKLFGSGESHMDYNTIPTTVFTPIEYGCIGYSEEDAERVFGAENIEVYHQQFTPLEWGLGPDFTDEAAMSLHQIDIQACSAKLICNKLANKQVVGFHYLGPNAGEVSQGFALAMRLGATKQDFDRTVGIHPTTAETLTTMGITKASGEDASAAGC